MGPSKSENNIDAIIKRGSHKSTSAIDTIIPFVSSMKIKNEIYDGDDGDGVPSKISKLTNVKKDPSLLTDHQRLEDEMKDNYEPFESSTLLRNKKTSIAKTETITTATVNTKDSELRSFEFPKDSSNVKESTSTTADATIATETKDCCEMALNSEHKSSDTSQLMANERCDCSVKSFNRSLKSGNGRASSLYSKNIKAIPKSSTTSQNTTRPRAKTEVLIKVSPVISPPAQRSKSRSFNDGYTSILPPPNNVSKVNGKRIPRKLPTTPPLATQQENLLSPINMPKRKTNCNNKKDDPNHKSKGSPKSRLFRTFSLPSSPFSTRKNDGNGDALKRNARSLRDRLRHSIHGRERTVSLPEHELFPEDREFRYYKGAVRRGRREAVISLEFNQSVSLLVKTDDRFLEFTFVPPYQLESI